MRKWLVLVMVAVMGAAVYAQELKQGTRELMIKGGWDPEGSIGTEWELEVGYGVFVRDRVEVGGFGYYSFSESRFRSDLNNWGYGGFVEYHIQTASATVPYVGAKVSYVYVDAPPVYEEAFKYGPRVGLKHFIADNVAIDIGLEYMLATEDIFFNDGVIEDSNLSVDFGLRITF